MKPKHYRVSAGEKLKLDHWATDDDGGLEKELAEARTLALRDEMAALQERLYAEGCQSLLIVLQARDAGGKDGSIKHVFSGLNPQGVHVAAFKVPTADEAAHDFLWRIHPHVPAAGRISIFNRSHYEDVLVTRAHQLIGRKELHRRTKHICDFEALLVDRQTHILKFYLHISKDEQLQRLKDRLSDPEKLWKFNPADLKERELWDDYTAAYQDTLPATSTSQAPWYVIPADKKWFRNLLISSIIVDRLKKMNPQTPEVDFDPAAVDLE